MMTSRSSLSALSLTLLVIASAAACTSDRGVAPAAPSEPTHQTAASTPNLPAILLQMSSGGLGEFPGAAAVSLATSKSGVAKTMIDPSECSYDAGIDGF